MEPAEYAAKRIREHDFGLSFSADPRFVNTHDQSRVRPLSASIHPVMSTLFLSRAQPQSRLSLTFAFVSSLLPYFRFRPAQWCYTLFNDYLRCKDKLGEDAPRCQYLNQKTNVICPISYLDKYREWIDEGKWYGYKAKNEDN